MVYDVFGIVFVWVIGFQIFIVFFRIVGFQIFVLFFAGFCVFDRRFFVVVGVANGYGGAGGFFLFWFFSLDCGFVVLCCDLDGAGGFFRHFCVSVQLVAAFAFFLCG